MTTLRNLSVAQLRQVIAIKEKIESLKIQLDSIANGHANNVAVTPKRRGISEEGNARIAAAQRRRWAKFHGQAASPAAPKKAPRRKVSAATRARFAAIAKARWAKAKASGKSTL
jgi:hypothetical protein